MMSRSTNACYVALMPLCCARMGSLHLRHSMRGPLHNGHQAELKCRVGDNIDVSCVQHVQGVCTKQRK